MQAIQFSFFSNLHFQQKSLKNANFSLIAEKLFLNYDVTDRRYEVFIFQPYY